MDYQIVKQSGTIDGQNYTAYYLVANVNGIELKLKLRANSTEKQLLELLLQAKSK